MNSGESAIRRLVRGILSEASLADRVPYEDPPLWVSTALRGGGGLKYGNAETTAWRRKVKRDWNAYADRALFDDPDRLRVVHFLGFYSGKHALGNYFPPATSVPGKIPGIDFPSKDELSCFGYLGDRQPRPINGAYFTFKKYRVTFASLHDAATERLSNATKADRARMAGSGLAKRPGAGLDTNLYPIDSDDMPADDLLEEVVIDNWIIDEYHGPVRDRKRAEELGIKFMELK